MRLIARPCVSDLTLTEERHPEMLKKAEVLTADRGYDDSKLLSRCRDEYGIKPVIDTRRLWKDGSKRGYYRDTRTWCMMSGERCTVTVQRQGPGGG